MTTAVAYLPMKPTGMENKVDLLAGIEQRYPISQIQRTGGEEMKERQTSKYPTTIASSDKGGASVRQRDQTRGAATQIYAFLKTAAQPWVLQLDTIEISEWERLPFG